MKEYMILVPILALFSLGLLIALRSGVADLATRESRRTVFDNFSGLIVRVLGYLAGLIAVQRLVGFPIEIPW